MENGSKIYSLALFLIPIILLSILFSSTASASTVQNASLAGSYAYITNSYSNTVSVISTITDTVTATVNVGSNPCGVAVTPDGKKVYVTGGGNVSIIDTATNNVIATVPVRSDCIGVAVSPDGKKVYATGGGNVSIIDTETNKVTATVPARWAPNGIAVNPTGRRIYVTNDNSNVSIIDTVTNTVIAAVNVGDSLTGVAVTPDGKKVYVAKYNRNIIFEIDALSNKVTAKVLVGNGPQGVAVTPDGKKVYVANYVDGTVSVIDIKTNKVTDTVNVGKFPLGVSVTSDGTKLYVANEGSDNVSIIDTITNKVINTVNVGPGPRAFGQFICPLPSIEGLPVANFISNVTSGFSPLSVQFTDLSENITAWSWDFGDGTNSTERNPTHTYSAAGTRNVKLVVSNAYGTDSKSAIIKVQLQGTSPVETYAYITNFKDNTVSVIDTARNIVTATVDVGSGPEGVAVTPDRKKVYVVNSGNFFGSLPGTVSVIDTATNKVIDTVNVGYYPTGIAVNPNGKKVYVASQGNVSVIDTTTNSITAKVNVGTNLWGIAVTPDGTKVYLTSSVWDNHTVSVIDTETNKVIDTVNVGQGPNGVAVNQDGTKVYVANSADGTVSVINTATNIVSNTVNVGNSQNSGKVDSLYGIAVGVDGKKVYVTKNFRFSANTAYTAKSEQDDIPPVVGLVAPESLKTVSIIDTATNTVIATVEVGTHPRGISVTPDGEKVYVVNYGDGTVSVIDTKTNNVTATVAVGNSPISLGQFMSNLLAQKPVLPVAYFSSSVLNGYAPLDIQFTDLSQNATEWNWDFGDGTNSTELNPTHTYSAAGIYNVKLVVNNENGTASNVATITVQSQSSSRGGSSVGSSQSSSGGGVGGSGGSPEPQNNVEAKELSQTFIASGQPVKFDFLQKATPVVYVSFDSKKTAGKTTTIVEMLKGKSTFASELPSDEVYKCLNIWVGNSGFATSKNIENAVVGFKVAKSWVQDKKIDKSTITLNWYGDKTWSQLPTTLSSEDDNYLYLTAKTSGFSEFVIAGKSIVTGTGIQPSVDKTQPVVNKTQNNAKTGSAPAKTEKTPEQKESPSTTQKQSTSLPGFEAVFGIVGLIVIFLYKSR